MKKPENKKLNAKDRLAAASIVAAALALAAYLISRLGSGWRRKPGGAAKSPPLSDISAVVSLGALAYFILEKLRPHAPAGEASDDMPSVTEESLSQVLAESAPEQTSAPLTGAAPAGVASHAPAPPPQPAHAVSPPAGADSVISPVSVPSVSSTSESSESLASSEPEAGRRWTAGALAIAGVGLIASAHYILSLRDLFKLKFDPAVVVGFISCLIPEFCSLRFPYHAFAAFVLIAGAALCWGAALRLGRVRPPVADLPLGPVQLAQISPRLRQPQFWILLVAFAGCEGYVAWLSISGKDVAFALWMAGLLLFLAVVLSISPAHRLRDLLWGALYMGGVLCYLIVAAAIGSGRFAPAAFGILGAAAGLGAIFYHWRVVLTRLAVLERLLLAAGAVAFLALLSAGTWHWHWAAAEDFPSEWDYYEHAHGYLAGEIPWPAMNSAGVYGGTGGVSSALQAASMIIFGDDVYGWRVSNYILLALALVGIYYFARQYGGAPAGIFTAALYASGHFLLSYSKTGFHTVQIVPIFILTLAALAWSAKRGNLAGYAVAGMILGLSFYTYGVGRLFFWVVGVWLLVYAFPIGPVGWRLSRSRLAVWVVMIVAVIITVFPIAASPAGWDEQLKRTIFIQSDVGSDTGSRWQQFATGVLYGLTQFLTSSANTTNVYGAHTDPISSSLIVLGVVALVAAPGIPARFRVFALASFLGLAVFVGGLQTYRYPSTNWMVALTPAYALLAALGLVVLVQVLAAPRGSPAAFDWRLPQWAAAVFVAGGIAALNLWLSGALSPSRLLQPRQNFVIQSGQIASQFGGSQASVYAIVPTDSQVYYLTDRLQPLIPLMYQAYNIPAPLTLLNQSQAKEYTGLCEAPKHAAVALVDIALPESDAIAKRIADCWPGASLHLVKDVTGRELFYRAFSAQIDPAAVSLPGYWNDADMPGLQAATPDPAGALWAVNAPVGIALDRDGRIAVAEEAGGRVVFFEADGTPSATFSGPFVYLAGIAFDSDNQLITLDAGSSNTISWFDSDNSLLKHVGGLSSPRGLFVAADETLYVAETGKNRIVHLDSGGNVLQVIEQPGLFGQPASVGVSPAGQIAVGDPIAGRVFVLSSSGELIRSFPISTGSTTFDKPGLAWLSESDLLYTDPVGGRVVLVRDDVVLKEWSDVTRPAGVVVADGMVYVLDTASGRVVPFELP